MHTPSQRPPLPHPPQHMSFSPRLHYLHVALVLITTAPSAVVTDASWEKKRSDSAGFHVPAPVCPTCLPLVLCCGPKWDAAPGILCHTARHLREAAICFSASLIFLLPHQTLLNPTCFWKTSQTNVCLLTGVNQAAPRWVPGLFRQP